MMVRVSNRKWIGWAAERPRFRSGYGVSTARRQPLYVPPVRDARSPTDPTQVVATCTASCRPLPSPRARYAPFSGPRRDRDVKSSRRFSGNDGASRCFESRPGARKTLLRGRPEGAFPSDSPGDLRCERGDVFHVSRVSRGDVVVRLARARERPAVRGKKSAAADFSSSTRFHRRPSRAPKCPRASPASRLPAVSPSRFAPMPRTSPST